ncbi:bifunctional ribonuclease/(p)ppGpp synthase [Nocardioides panacihumi]|uniref:Bifunctional ribonuclease/(P)ppGpp synthase n=1 Tax=Nocardioides panacihumi TaxID=400774 RepID=A0ABN2RVS3_9ACTN
MYFVGVDLAWGERRPTGLAVLDDAGRLVHVSAATSDDDIVAALGPYVDDDCLVAIDAPLIVNNASGNRPAEAQLNADFARFDAGAHPSNTGKPEFREQPRGARIAARLGLDMNPRSGRARRAIEVYPHPATVALFRLGRTLKYKNKPGRDLAQLRAELMVLLDLLESRVTADPPLVVESPGEERPGSWQALRSAVESAQRKSELRVVEDQVDAVVCAYVALFATRSPERTTTYGDFETGYIVTPTLPADLTPTPRPRRATAITDPDAAVREYARKQPQRARATDQFVQLVTAILDDAGINYLTVTGRAKSVSSFATKAARAVDGRRVFLDPLQDITDQIGIRVITYVHSDVQAVVDLLSDQVIVHDDRDMGRETADEGRFGYASRHLLVSLDPARETPDAYDLLPDRQAQVQIRTVLQHAWAEFEHDIRYKGTIPSEHVPEFDRRFTLAAGLLELADREFSAIRDRLREGMTGTQLEPMDDDPRISPRELAAFLAGQYADAGWSRIEHYAWISTLVLELGIASLVELATCLRSVDEETLAARMEYRYPPGAVRRLDDALLWAYGDTYVDLGGNAHRHQALRERLAKMRGA